MTLTTRIKHLLLALVLGSFAGGVHAAAGDLDSSFTLDAGLTVDAEYMNSVNAIAIQADGKIVVGGYPVTVNDIRTGIARLNVDGSLDGSFNPGSGVDGSVAVIALQPDGKILVGGGFSAVNGSTKKYLARLNADGSLDGGFSPAFIANNCCGPSINAIAIQADGKILVGGTSSYSDVDSILRLNADGSRDNTFDADYIYEGRGAINTISIQADGKIIIGGEFSTGVINYISRLNSDGTQDDSFNIGSGAGNWVLTSAVQPDGKILIGGDFIEINGVQKNHIARLNADGSLDNTFLDAIVDNLYFARVSALAILPDGKIIIGRSFLCGSETSLAKSIMRLNVDGSVDNSFTSATDDPAGTGDVIVVNAIAVQADGNIIVSGWHDNQVSQESYLLRLIAISDTDWDGLQDSVDPDDDNDTLLDGMDNCPVYSNVNQLNTDADAFGDVCDSDDDNDGIDDGLDAFPLDGTETVDNDGDGLGNNIDNDDDNDGTDDGLDACPLDSSASSGNVDGDILCDITDTDDDNDTVLDDIDNCPSVVNTNQIDSDTDGIGDVCDITPLPAAGYLDDSFGSESGADGIVVSSAIQGDGKLVLGGGFANIDGIARAKITRLNSTGLLDASFNPGSGVYGVGNTVKSVNIQVDGKIVIAGEFLTINGIAKKYIARFNVDGSLDGSFNSGAGPNTDLSTAVLQADGKIIIGGGFVKFNGITINRIARLNVDGTLDLSFNPGLGPNYTVVAAAVQSDGKIIIAGDFSSVNGVQRNKIARLNADGSVDSGFNPGSGVSGYISTFVLQPDGKILIGGFFTSVNGASRRCIARLNVDGSVDQSFNSSSAADSTVFTIAVQTDGKVLIGGAFTAVNGTVRNRIARLNADGSLDQSFNPGSGANGTVYTSAVQADGMIVVGGEFTSINGTVRNHVARIHTGDADGDGIEDAADTNAVKNDYNHGGIAGWIWQGVSNGVETQTQIWQLGFPLYSANFAPPTRTFPPVFADQANWDIVTSGDFNKDGDADILWRHKITGAWKIWQMQDGLRVAQTNWTDSFDPEHQWQVIGAGDTDKDGDDDIIFNNANTGEILIWEVQNYLVAATHNIGTKAGYTLNRIGDFNKDGDVDLLFRQNSGDALVTWEIENNTFVTERALANTGTGYNPVCAGDFDNDGDDDIMLVNSTTQQEKWFVMENYTRTQQFGGTNDGFVFLGCGDYDGDGDADTLWQRSADDMNRIVLQQNWGATKQTVYTNPFGGANGFVYRGNSN